MADSTTYLSLESQSSSVIIDCTGNAPAFAYWGRRLGQATTPEMLDWLGTRQQVPARVDTEAPISLSPETGSGFMGSPGLQLHRDGKRWAVFAGIDRAQMPDRNRILIESTCQSTNIRILHELALDSDTDVLVATTTVENTGDSALTLDFCAAPTVPLPLTYDTIRSFEGRWCNEFQMRTIERFCGSFLRENRTGRTSHDCFPGLIVHTANATERTGSAYAFHLGWSGNHRMRIDELSDGRAYAQFGELLFPGEVILEPGERYRSPRLYGVHSSAGFGRLSRCLHRYVRENLTDARTRGRPRPVHFNSWEATYFDLSPERLIDLAEEAAAVGVERFVLDDGWFRHRRSDQAGLGDWYVDETIFPDGLAPLIDRITALGMEFGLWLEPECVSPDSDLYRNHPDWALATPPAPPVMARNQLVLDLTNTAVRDYLFERIDALLREYPISYLKWDMNRDLSQPGDAAGRAASHRQTLALYGLLQRLRSAHPEVEIESCASGGGRADYGILEHVDRFWTSDNNDALDRLRIQRGFSYFFPAEFMGAHVGPGESHTTGRRIRMATRCGVAMFGSMGIEANLLDIKTEEKDELRAAIDLHKLHRELISGGQLYRLETAGNESAFGIVSDNRREALFSYAKLSDTVHSAPGRLYFDGLDEQALYTIRLVWPRHARSFSTSILDVLGNETATGDALMNAGLQLPILFPESVLVFHLAAAR